MEKENKSGKSHAFRITLNHVKSRITERSNFRQFKWYELLNFTLKTELIIHFLFLSRRNPLLFYLIQILQNETENNTFSLFIEFTKKT